MAKVEASMQDYIKGSKGPFITVDYNGQIERPMQRYSGAVSGPL
jgi:hypothetical protein